MYGLHPGPAGLKDMREHPGWTKSLVQTHNKYGSVNELCG